MAGAVADGGPALGVGGPYAGVQFVHLHLGDLFPEPPLLSSWLAHRWFSALLPPDMGFHCGKFRQYRVSPVQAAFVLAAFSSLPAEEVARQSEAWLAALKAEFLAGHQLVRYPDLVSLDGHLLLVPSCGLEAVAALAQQVLTSPELARARLPRATAAPLRPPPPPKPPGALVDAPAPLRGLFEAGSALAQQLRALLMAALGELRLTCSLAAPPWGAAAGPRLALAVSGDLDFGLQQIAAASPEGLRAAAAELRGRGAAGRLLDVLQLKAAPGADGLQERPAAASVLLYRHLTIENVGGEECWLLGGVAAPSFPGTLAVIDDAALLWEDGHRAVGLPPGARHTLTVALSRADGPFRRQEHGVMQQALLLIVAVRRSCAAARRLLALPQALSLDVGQGPSGFSVFVVGRRITAALVRRAGDVTALLSAEAKPFIPASLRRVLDQGGEQATTLFDSRLLAQLRGVDLGCRSWDLASLHLQCLESESVESESPWLQKLRQFKRLLSLEEAAIEQDMRRHDMFNARLRLVRFNDDGVRYTLFGLTGVRGAGVEALRSTVPYRGPPAGLLQASPLCQGELNSVGLLDVPGLLEGRPAVNMGDTVRFRIAADPSIDYCATVLATSGSTAFLLLPHRFWAHRSVTPLLSHMDGRPLSKNRRLDEPFDGLIHVRFTLDRSALHRMGLALVAANTICMGFAIPPDLPGADPALMGRLCQLQPPARLVASDAAALRELGSRRLNREQRQAVAAVLAGAGRAMPFALFGPPGTGKSVTLAECALQLLRGSTPGGGSGAGADARILLAAPQNYSADLLCSALAEAGVGREEMVRLNDPRRPPATVKEDVLPYCWLEEALRMFTLPSEEELCRRRVVVCSCVAAGLLADHYGQTSPALAFSHVLIDEAGQALLPEALIPLQLLSPRAAPGAAAPGDEAGSWGAVLCGDPRQLGPVVRSPAAAAAGLSRSLLDLLIGHHGAVAPALEARGLAPPVVQLVSNYRSHRRLLDLPSKMFYQGTLVAAADPAAVRAPAWEQLRPDAEGGGSDHGTEGGSSGAGSASEEEGGEGDDAGNAALALAPAVPGGAAVDVAAADGVEGIEVEDAEVKEEDGGEEGSIVDPEGLPNLLVYGERGAQAREGEAPSYFNAIEASTVVSLVEGLLRSGPGVQPADIGVMATYRLQVQKLRLLLRQRGLGSIRVGTCDDFQGQEERIVFISTVLSRPESLPALPGPASAPGGAGPALDLDVGFWRNPKRFNVAITRAKALLVVVGHPAVLMEDASWRELLRYCLAQGAYRGAGADSVHARFSVGLNAGASGDAAELAAPWGPSPGGEAGGEGGEGGAAAGDAELAAAVAQMAEMALLGSGHADSTFGGGPDALYDMYAEETPFRVML